MLKKILYPTGSAIEQLSEDLKLSEPDEFEQDWEYVIVDEIDEQKMMEIMNYYHNSNLDDEVKFTLMIVIIGYCNDMMGENNLDNHLWEQVEKILIAEQELHLPTIEYWSSLDVELEDAWYIAPLMRTLLMNKIIYDMSGADLDVHTTFYNWILETKSFWHSKGIEVDEITDLRTGRPYPAPPFVAVEHQSSKGFGAIHLYQVNKGYIIEFYTYPFADDEESVVYIHEFSKNPTFDLWQERYVALLSKK